MDIIKFDNLFWLRKFNKELQQGYKKMFYPNDENFNILWELYVDTYFKAKEIGLLIPEETEYPIFVDYYLDDTYDSYSEYHKKKYREFCEKMNNTINKINIFLEERG